MRSVSRVLMAVVAVFAISIAIYSLGVNEAEAKGSCATIQGGTITDSGGSPIRVGFDEFGYNYQAHLFVGPYSDVDRIHGGLFSDVNLQMKWNDAWLSNKDCDGSTKLDRSGDGDDDQAYIGSGAWLTNHDTGISDDGSHWAYFVKIVAVPADATLVGGVWYAADGGEIGPVIWGQFAVVQQIVSGDIPIDFVNYDLPFPGSYISPTGPGLGNR